jgi:lipopolysaccharide export system permease protein
MMSFPQLHQYVRLLESQNKDVSEEATKLHLKLAVPLATIVIAILMCAHVMRASPRGVLIGFGGGLAWVVSYYIVLLGCKKLGYQGTLASPALAAWLPNVAFGLIGLVSLIRRGAR